MLKAQQAKVKRYLMDVSDITQKKNLQVHQVILEELLLSLSIIPRQALLDSGWKATIIKVKLLESIQNQLMGSR